MSFVFGNQTHCQICQGTQLEPVLTLGHQPIVQEYLTNETLHQPEVTYPLNLCRCQACGLLQLDYVPDAAIVFPASYPYRTGLTNMLINNFRALAEKVTTTYQLTANDLVIDIGSNDGTLLQGFKDKGCRVLGVEPTDAAKVANANGIPTIQAFFDAESAAQVNKEHGKARIVTAANVFAHIYDAPALVESIKQVMAPGAVFISESQYLLDIFEKLEFETIYHEHLRFYSLKPLAELFRRAGCSLVDAERISAAGGSIRAYAVVGDQPMSDRLKELIVAEEEAGLYDAATWRTFALRVIKAKHDLQALLVSCKRTGARLAGLGSPARANTLLGFTKLDEQLLDYAGEKTGSPKIGLFTPGTHIPVVDEQKMYTDQPDYLVVLSWHIGPELMNIVRKKGYRGKFIMPLPEPHVVETI